MCDINWSAPVLSRRSVRNTSSTRSTTRCSSQNGPERPPPRSRQSMFEAPIGDHMTIERMHTGPRMSQVVIHNTTVYLAGQVASGAPGKSVAEQTKDILSTIDSLLAGAKTDKSKLLSATICMTDMATVGAMKSVWD